ncbi:hypothetical protein [Prescottella equi]|jgi:hypothetical protein|uniref:hypothetical protein n=1 Tax=Rhodococcus hoagii TaxID=43767 RepID=UPI0007CD5724|nr:hypothetical protein [Prescottella equi]ORL11649.1 hypothetical protein A6I85_17165 [Prescottella equi]ORL90894.1 hypothetical protein A5N78_06525 [Prescottella equi]ORM22782.1 hypothetical protein A5N70_00990 [Prescottella equi]QDP12582.1 hypothetical protein FNU77_24140 [Prescottella equi]
MANGKPGSIRFSSKDAKAIMASKHVQAATAKQAKVGADAFRKEARRHKRSGQLADKVRVEPAKGWDGRPGSRIVASRRGNQSALFGTSRSRPVRAQEAAIRAMNQRRRY